MSCPSQSGVAVASFLFLAMSTSAHAQLVNGSFETGASKNATTIAGWTAVGNAFLSETSNFSTPTSGTYQATVATALDGQYGEHAGSGVTAATAETFLGLPGGALSAVGNGTAVTVSALRQTLTLNAGDKLLFDYDFLTDEVYKATDLAFSASDRRPATNRNDFGFLSVSRAGGTATVVELIDTFYGYTSTGPGQSDFNTGLVPTPETDPLFSESKYLAFTYTVPSAGVYTFGLGVSGGEVGAAGTSGSPSGMLFDNARLILAPEPATLAIGFLATTVLGRRRRASV